MSKRTLKLMEQGGTSSRFVDWGRKRREARARLEVKALQASYDKQVLNPSQVIQNQTQSDTISGPGPALDTSFQVQRPSLGCIMAEKNPECSGELNLGSRSITATNLPNIHCQAEEMEATESTFSSQPDGIHSGNGYFGNDAPDIGGQFGESIASGLMGRLASKVCKCVDTTVGDVLFMCLSLGMRHNLTWAAQVDILEMVSTICRCSEIPCSKRGYLKYFGNHDHKITAHVFCDDCENYIGEKDPAQAEVKCSICSKVINQFNPSNFFLYISLESQLKSLLNNNDISEKLRTYRFQRVSEEGVLTDLYDGAYYKKYFNEGGILRDPLNFSWTFFTDGISTGKSNGKTMWPLYATINELPYRDRMKHMLIGGLYVGQKDPNPLIFLKPFVAEANKLASEGFEWTLRDKVVVSRVIPLIAIMDSVARCKMCNMQSFHAFFGCTYCYIQQTKTSDNTRRYAFADSVNPEPRTADSTFSDAIVAMGNRGNSKDPGHFRGVKGPSPFMGLKYFDVIAGCVVDYMHAVLLGVVKTHMETLFETGNTLYWIVETSGNVAAEHIITCIDERLLNICPPACITRLTRSMSQWRLWKASEWRSWLLFYCVPCLVGLLQENHLRPLVMLSTATCILLQRNVRLEAVTEAHNLYMGYYRYFEESFDIRHTVYNIHLLTHICDCVRNWGPLFVQSALPYEGQNMHLLQLYQSPNQVLKQITKKFLIYKSLPALCGTIVSSERALTFAEKVLESPFSRFTKSGECVLSIKIDQNKVAGDERDLILGTIPNEMVSKCIFYHRALHRGIRISSTDYTVGKRRDDSLVVCSNGRLVSVKVLVRLPTGKVFVVGREVEFYEDMTFGRGSNKTRLSHVRQIRSCNTLVSVPISDVQTPAIRICVSKLKSYASSMPFGCYGD